jgi:putative spermidine/putrescine transport system permease protein
LAERTTPGAAARIHRAGAPLGLAPFFLYTGIFLLVPTGLVVVKAFLSADNVPTLGNIRALAEPQIMAALTHSVVLSAVTAIGGAVLGALLSYLVASSRTDSVTRRVVTAASGVLSQLGGVTLAFAFIATLGFNGFVTLWLKNYGIDLAGSTWLYEWNKGLVLVYLYFQIPLMVLVFLPAVDGLRAQWREATETLGGSAWDYWRHVGGPILLPSFLGATLLLFTNAFSAYATAAALISQGSPILPLQIGGAMSSEVVLGQENVGTAMALAMVVVVAVVMTLYALLDRRTSRWLAE